MPQYQIYRFDVTTLSQEQRNMLDLMVTVQAEESDQDLTYSTGLDNYTDVPVARVCPWCHADLVDGECGGEGEGTCTESDVVVSYLPSFGTPEEFVKIYAEQEGLTNALVPYRRDGLTYFDQLAYLIREYHGLEQPRKASRRLP